MTDRIDAFIVVLEKDMRDDDVQPTLEAIKHIRGILSVTPHKMDISGYVTSARVRAELFQQILRLFYPEKGIE